MMGRESALSGFLRLLAIVFMLASMCTGAVVIFKLAYQTWMGICV